MRKRDPAITFGAALCGFGCGAKWSKWCRGCNLVYCDKHIEHKAHKCKRIDLAPSRIFGEPPPKKKKRRVSKAPTNGAAAPPAEPASESQLPFPDPKPPEKKDG